MFDDFKIYNHEIFLTGIVLLGWLFTKVFVKRTIKRVSINYGVTVERRRIIVKVTNLIFLLLVVVFITTIWGVNKKDLFFFFTSIITVLGIAFFAQWSILSNITSGIIIFFSHPLKLGDHVRILDKEYPVEGKIVNISFFFMHLENEDKEKITIPNAIALQKTILIVEKH